MWLYAGNTSISFKYSNLFIVIVTKLKQWSQSAGNIIKFTHEIYKVKFFSRTSETLRHKSKQSENVNEISIHVPKHLKPLSELEFGHYLAGLIDGDGYFSNKLQLVIAFNESDASLAYYIKQRIGYGNVYKIKNKKAVILVISNYIGLIKVLNLINGKIRSENKLIQINNNILTNSKFHLIEKFYFNCDENLNNYWLAGFADADASFQIKLIIINNRTEVRLNFQIDQKKDYLLKLIKKILGGNIGYRHSQDTYYYGSTSFGSAKKVINYFDRFHLLSSKYNNYLKWRKAYIEIQNKNHLNDSGLNKIINIKNRMNRNNSDN